MRPEARRLAEARMDALYALACSSARADPALARRQAAALRAVGTRCGVRLPARMRASFCRRCKSFSPPWALRTRVGGRGARALRTACPLCGSARRRILDR